RRERDDLHVVAIAKLACNRAKDARAARVALVVDEDGRVLVEADVAAIRAAVFLRRADHDGADHVALLHGGRRDGLLDAGNDHVTHAGRGLLRAAHDPDALDRACARVVGDLEAGLLLDHAGLPSPSAAAPVAASSAVARRPGWAAAWIASVVSL